LNRFKPFGFWNLDFGILDFEELSQSKKHINTGTGQKNEKGILYIIKLLGLIYVWQKKGVIDYRRSLPYLQPFGGL